MTCTPSSCIGCTASWGQSGSGLSTSQSMVTRTTRRCSIFSRNGTKNSCLCRTTGRCSQQQFAHDNTGRICLRASAGILQWWGLRRPAASERYLKLNRRETNQIERPFGGRNDNSMTRVR